MTTKNTSTAERLFGCDTVYSNGEKYLTRLWFWVFRIHIFHRGDPGEDLHDHPFSFITFPLNSYVEEVRPDYCWHTARVDTKIVKAFRFHYRSAGHIHRVLGRYVKADLPNIRHSQRRIITLVIRGRRSQNWGFHVLNERWEYVPHQNYNQKGKGKDNGCEKDSSKNNEQSSI